MLFYLYFRNGFFLRYGRFETSMRKKENLKMKFNCNFSRLFILFIFFQIARVISFWRLAQTLVHPLVVAYLEKHRVPWAVVAFEAVFAQMARWKKANHQNVALKFHSVHPLYRHVLNVEVSWQFHLIKFLVTLIWCPKI